MSLSFALGWVGVTLCALLPAAGVQAADSPVVELQPGATPAIIPFVSDLAREGPLSRPQQIALLRQKVKYVFVLLQENRSFDSYFGTFPGVRGLYSQPPGQTPGYSQPIVNTDGSMTAIQPFRIGPAQFAADIDDPDHSYAVMGAKMNVQNGKPLMDRFALAEEMNWVPPGQKPSLKAKQYGELAMAYMDCDTVPFLWNYANRFIIFDNYFQHTIGPSTPGALNLIAAQTGETQWVKHPETASTVPANAARGLGEPVTDDVDPFWGSADDHSHSGMPINPNDNPAGQLNQTYATLPLTLTGIAVAAATGADHDPARDLADIRGDIPAIATAGRPAIPWGWYQEGFDREPTDPPGGPPGGTHTSYLGHHNAPQFFGYVANNPKLSANLHGLNDFFVAMAARALPAGGGLFYVRGGFQDIQGLKTVDPDPAVRKRFEGDDDHPGYSDAQISEALVAREVNAIARSPYWDQSVIVVTYDESGGSYDHVRPPIVENGPSRQALSTGPRIPLVIISPYAKAHAVSHELGQQASVVRMIDTLFGLPPLADLPDELAARVAGQAKFGQSNLGPADDMTPGVGELLSAFDANRLAGRTPTLPAAYAEIPDAAVQAMPPFGNEGCRAIGMVPTDYAESIDNPVPADFNPRPSTNPTPGPR
ncbi:MAG TPA: alkaline phosphatase family protein [Acetobacteraceae bacterium]